MLLQRLFNKQNTENSIRAIVFNLPQAEIVSGENYLFAFPLEAVTKIVVCPPLTSKMKQGIGSIELDSEMLTIVDLSYQFGLEPSIESYKFLILFQLNNGESCGIPLSKSPLAIDIPLNTIRPVPPSFRQVNNLDFAPHMAIVPNPEDTENQTIYLIGMTDILLEKAMIR
jgi:chemotaxis signal transduction protein